MRMTIDEFCEKMGMVSTPVGGQVTFDGSHPHEERTSLYNKGPVSHVWDGAKEGDPNREDKAPPPAKVTRVGAKTKLRVADNEGPVTPRKTPITNIKSASPVLRFFGRVLEKLGDEQPGQQGPLPGMPAPTTGFQPLGESTNAETPPSSSPMGAGGPTALKTGSAVLDYLKQAMGEIGAGIGSPARQTAGLGTQTVPAPAPDMNARPKGNVLKGV